VSSNDFDGPHFGPAGGRGADEPGAKALGAFGQGADGEAQGASGTAGQYPAPEGWGNDGTWRDSAIDSNYETGVQGAVRPVGDPHAEPGYSYFSDGRGWESKPGANGTSAQPAQPSQPAQPPQAAAAAAGVTAAGVTAAGATAVGATAIGATAVGAYGPGGNPTSVYGAGSGVPGGTGAYGAPMGPGPGGYGNGPGGPFGPGGPGGPGGPRGPFGPNGKRKGNWWRHWTWKKALALTGGVFALLVIAMFGGYQYMASSATIPAALASANYQNTTVYYADGKTVMGTIGTTNRQDLTYQQIPQQLQNAVVAAEDKNFWTEGGVSPTGILRSAIHDVTDPGDLNGGSTITQEFVRNYYDGVGTQQTASRKIKEIFIAQKVAATESKQWILTNFMNLIPMGQGAFGVEAAAETYFGVPVSKLTVSEDAVLAGLIQAPSAYSESSNRSLLQARWTYVLQQMVDAKDITAAQMSTMKLPTLLTYKNGAASGTSITDDDNAPWVPYIMAQVESELTSPVADGGDGISQSELETGGLKIVTTISRSMEKELYNAVDENLNSQSISETSGATVTSLPSWALVGAELQDPKTGQILAEYPGKGQTMTAKHVCAAPDCQDNTAVYTREQVGSSFKPYVLATAVSQGMNVKTSTLDTSPYECIAPDSPVTYSTPITESVYELPGLNNGCSVSGAEKVENDAGELIGKNVGTVSGAPAYSDNVQDALAQSSNTGFSDLAHRVGTANVYTMAGNFGVNLNSYADGGSGLSSYIGDSGMALGIAPLTVNEQTQMLATIADNGLYHQGHVIKYWQQGDDTEQMPHVTVHTVLTPSEDAQVQYAMEQTTIDGTAAQTVTYGQQTPGTVIGKTGTTSSSHAGFFIGSTTQYTLVVGMFTVSQADNYPNNLSMLGGGGFGGYWPAKIWNTFAEAEFSPNPTLFSTSPAFTGSAWNLLGPVTKPKPTVTCTVNGHKQKVSGKTCPTQNYNNNCQYQGQQNCNDNGANPSPSCSYDDNGNYTCTGGTATPSPSCSYDDNGNYTCSGNGTTATPTPTCSYDQSDGQYDLCDGNSGNGNSNDSTTPTTSAAQGGLAVGGGLLLLPGSLLWTTISRRRRRKQRASKAKSK
jgi:membrane peptidoglycan carboxypeptidase